MAERTRGTVRLARGVYTTVPPRWPESWRRCWSRVGVEPVWPPKRPDPVGQVAAPVEQIPPSPEAD